MSDILKDLDAASDELDQKAAVDAHLADTFAGPTDQDIQDAEAEIVAEEQYGDSSLRAGLEGAARGASLGISDQVLKSAGADMQGVKQRSERNPVAATVGNVAGTVAGLLTPMGPLNVVARGGKVAEKGAELALRETLKGTGRAVMAKSIAKTLAPKVAAGAVEGGAIGVGQLLTEDALGDSKLNAENIIASFGAGAALGGAVNLGLAGAASAVPSIKRGIKPISDKLTKGAKKLMDPVEAVKSYSGFSPSQIVKIEKRNPSFFKDLPDYYRNRLKLKMTDTAEDVAAKNAAVKAEAGKTIDSSVQQLDAFSAANPELMPRRASVYDDLLTTLKDKEEQLLLTPETSRAELRALRSYKNEVINYGTKDTPLTFGELNSLRRAYDKQAKFNPLGSPADNFKASVAADLRSVLRNKTDDIAALAEVSGISEADKLAAKALRQANKDYHVASTLDEKLSTRAEKSGFSFGLKDMVQAGVFTGIGGLPGAAASVGLSAIGGSDLARKAVILADVKKMSDAFSAKLNGSVKLFFNKAPKTPKPVSHRVLLTSFLSKPQDSKSEPKTRKEAFINVRNNLTAMATDPEKSINQLARSTALISEAAPKIAQDMHASLTAAMVFLNEKLPRNNAGVGSFLTKRAYEPSSIELGKFERYMQVIEAPATVLDDLERGTLTREHIEALKAVYPAIYEQLQASVMEQLVDSDSVSYNKRLQLGVLLDIPTDESLLPENIMGLQQNFSSTANPESPSESINTSQVASSKKSDRLESGIESATNRRS
jgi:hypothetical protein